MNAPMNGLATGGRKLEEMAQMVAQMEEDGVAGEHMKAMWAGQSNVLVAVRVRPLLKHDVIKKNIVRVLDAKIVVIMDPAHDKNDVLRGNRSREKQYAFDYVFEPGSSQQSVYNHTSKFLIQGVLDGFNATVFAYGNTGAGKTHTMIGSTSEPGIMVRVMNDLFLYTEKTGKSLGVVYKIRVSFLEVYNENIKDLLSDVEEYLDLREDPIAGPTVPGITEVETKSSAEIMNLLHTGNQRRTQQATAANEVSSRSHAVLQVVVECKDRAPGTVANIKVSKLSLVDLAGSERAANTKNSGKRLVEGANINRSLLALGNCINALAEKGHKGNFVPYRDSKLTRLLKDSLGGNCRTVMIANIGPAESSFEETLNTLKYANRAKNIKTNVQRNVLNVNHHISEYVNLITNLRGEIKLLKEQIGQSAPVSVDMFSPGHSTTGGQHTHPPSPKNVLRQPSTPLQALRDSMRSAASLRSAAGEGRELVNGMRQKIVDNFQERMQLRRSLIELEDQNVQNSIEVSKRQLVVVQWSGNVIKQNCENPADTIDATALTTQVLANGPPQVKEALAECEQLRKAIAKNNAMKKNIEKRLRNNERDAEQFRSELGSKITGEDRKELMELQYQVGKLELENMELEQHRIVHESILKGKDLMIHKLQLQLAVKDKIIKRQKMVLAENGLNRKVGYDQLAAMERALMDADYPMSPPSPPRSIGNSVAKLNLQGSPLGPIASLSNPSTHRDPLTPKQIDRSRIEPNEWPEFDKHENISPAQKARIPPISKHLKHQKEVPSKHLHRRNDANGYNGDLEGFEDSGDFQGHSASVESNGIANRQQIRGKPSKNARSDQRPLDMNSDDGEDSTDKLSNFGVPGFGGRHLNQKGSSPLVFPENSERAPSQVKNVGIRAGGGLNHLGDLGVVGQNRLTRQGRGRGQPLQGESRWMDGGAGGGDPELNAAAKGGGNYQPHSPRGSGGGGGSFGRERQFKGAYESKFDRETKIDAKYDDVEIDEISEANDDNSVHSDFSNDLSPAGGRKSRKQRNQALGKLKRRMKTGTEIKNSGVDGEPPSSMRINPQKGRASKQQMDGGGMLDINVQSSAPKGYGRPSASALQQGGSSNPALPSLNR